MRLTRIFQPIHLSPDTTITLDEKAHHHLYHVLRANKADALVIFNGSGGEYSATIIHIDKKQVKVEIHAYVDRNVESPLAIHLAQGIARGEKMDFIIQKSVELGVARITPLITERTALKTEVAKSEKRAQHWQAIAVSACEQCGRTRVPTIEPAQNYYSWLSANKIMNGFILTPHDKHKLPKTLAHPQAGITLVIGPEGGLNPDEIAAAETQKLIPLNLGPRILRTETATLAAVTVMQYQYGDMG